MSGRKPMAVQVCFWSGGWYLVGNGPAYLLFHAPKMEVTHLVTGLHRQLREALKGYSVIQDGKLLPLVQALILLSADVIYDVDPRRNARVRKWATYIAVREIEELIRQFPKRTTFEARLRRLNSSLRAAGQYAMHHGPPGVPEGTSPPGSFFAHDQYGQRLLVTRAGIVYRCEPDSPIAGCAIDRWHREQARWGNGCTVLYRVPARRELRAYLCCDESTITKLCRREGFDWLPSAPKGRRKAS